MDPTTKMPGWRPAFVDYLYLSFTNCTAFSPTDTMPLTARAKLLMLGEAAGSLATAALVLARAVNLLGTSCAFRSCARALLLSARMSTRLDLRLLLLPPRGE